MAADTTAQTTDSTSDLISLLNRLDLLADSSATPTTKAFDPGDPEAYLSHAKPGLQIALVASAAGLAGLAAISVALVISADLRARAIGTAGQYRACGQVAATYEVAHRPAPAPSPAARTLAPQTGAAPPAAPAPPASPAPTAAVLATDQSVGLLALAASGRQVQARVAATGDLLYVTGVRYTSGGGLKLRLTTRAAEPADTGTWYDLFAIDEFDTTA